MTSVGLTKAQRNQILTTTEITSATKALTVGQIEERIATELNSKEDAKAITQKLTKIGIISSESGATTSLTVDILEQAVANGTLTASEASSIASALGLTVANTSLSVSFKVLTSTIWANIKALLVWLTTNPVGWAILATSALYRLAKVFVENTTSIEEAKEETKKYVDTLSSINSEVENLESRLKDLNNQINNLNPITDAEDIENLKLESAELENQLAILKEKQRLASIEADKASQESLSMTQTSRYDFGEGKTHNALTGETLEYKTAVEVTRMKELQNAMDAYDEYANKQSELRAELAKLAESGEYTQEEWDNFETSINDLDIKMQETRTHASELASELNEEKKGLNGVDESSKKLLEDTNSVLNSYSAWTDEINTTTNALKENSNVQSSTLDNKNPVLLGIPETIDELNTKLKPAMDSLAEAYQDIFTSDGEFVRENINLDMFSSIKDELDELSKAGINIDYSSFEEFVSTLNDVNATSDEVDNAFDKLATTISRVVLSGTEDFETLKASLSDLGVVNSEIVAFGALVKNTEALKEAGLDLETANKKAMVSFVNETVSAEYASQALAMLMAQQLMLSDGGINTVEECNQLLNIAKAAKVGQIELQRLNTLMDLITKRDTAVKSGDARAVSELNRAIKDFSSQVTADLDLTGVEVDFKQIDTSSASKAGKDAGEEYKEALEKELDDLGDVISHVSDIIGDQIDIWNDQKDSAVDALEAQKDAAEEALQAQIDLVETQIKAKKDEIDAIKEAREERDLELASQKALYEWNHMISQRTRLIYKTGNDGIEGQMVYDHDISEIRNKKEEYDRIQEDKKINRIEKEISGLEDIIDGLNEQIDASNKYYDDLIKQTEKYYDNLIKGMEEFQSRWEELGNIEEQAKIDVLFNKYGLKANDILNMSEEAFNSFKQQYLTILTEMYSGEEQMISAINDVANGINLDGLTEGLNKTKDNIDNLNGSDFNSVKTGLNNVSTELDNVGTSASTASTNISTISNDLGEMNTKTEGLDTKLNNISSALNSFPTGEKFEGLSTQFVNLAEAIQSVATALGITADTPVSGLVTALSTLSTLTLGDESTGIIAQFNALKTAVDAVTSSITGGGSKDNENGGLATGENGGSVTPNMGEGNGTGLTGAITNIGTTTNKILGAVGESEGGESEEGEGVLGKFAKFKSAVDEVTKAIGTDEETDDKEANLISALRKHYEVAGETIPEVKSFFEELLMSISACVEKLGELSSGISSLGNGGIPVEPNAKGTSYAKKGLHLVGEEKPELVEDTKGNLSLVAEPTLLNMEGGEKVYNGEETKSLLKGNKIYDAWVEYTTKYANNPALLSASIMETSPQLFTASQDIWNRQMDYLTSKDKVAPRVENKSNSYSVGDVHIHCSGITSEDVAKQTVRELDKQLFGMQGYFRQKASITR